MTTRVVPRKTTQLDHLLSFRSWTELRFPENNYKCASIGQENVYATKKRLCSMNLQIHSSHLA